MLANNGTRFLPEISLCKARSGFISESETQSIFHMCY